MARTDPNQPSVRPPGTVQPAPIPAAPAPATTTTIGAPAYHYAGYLSYPTNVASELPIPELAGPATVAASWTPTAPLAVSLDCPSGSQQTVGTSSASLTVRPAASCVLTLTEQSAVAAPVEYQIDVTAPEPGSLQP